MVRFQGAMARTEEEAHPAIAFALVTASPERSSFYDRFVVQAKPLSRAERTLFEEWARCRFSIFRVAGVEPGAWIELHDVLADRLVHVLERAGSQQVKREMWLAAFVFSNGPTWSLEGTIAIQSPSQRIHAVQAALGAFANAGVDPIVATPDQTRRVANAVHDAMNHANRPPRIVNADGDDVLLINAIVGGELGAGSPCPGTLGRRR